MNSYKYIDLFAGAGGLSLGFGDQQFQLEFANDFGIEEIKTFKSNLKKSHPETSAKNIVGGDIKKLSMFLSIEDLDIPQLDFIKNKMKIILEDKNSKSDLNFYERVKKLFDSINNIDVIVGGPPCQGFSVINKTRRQKSVSYGIDYFDPRNDLYLVFISFLNRYNPKLVLIENVKGMTSVANYREMIESSLDSAGYIAGSQILNAKDFGIPQNRERIFFIGIKKDDALKNNITPEQVFLKIKEYKTKQVTVAQAIDDLPIISSNHKSNNYRREAEISFEDNLSFGMDISDKVYKELLIANSGYRNVINRYRNRMKNPKYLYNHKSRYNNDRDLFIYKNLVPGKYLDDPSNELALSKVTYGVTNENGKRKISSFKDKYFKLDDNGVSKTILSHLEVDGNSYVHPGKNPRSISPREAARLQSFPDWYQFKGSTRKQFRQIGNAVPPLLAKIIAREFRNVLDIIYSNEKK